MALMGGVLILGRCNPYGAESGGPRHVMGGLHGPASATLPGAGLPDNVEQGEWACPQPAAVRVRMVCRCGHTGKVMDLCSWHDAYTYKSEMVAGSVRRVKEMIRCHGHYEEISRRQAGACIRCLYPGQHAEQYKAMMAWQGELAMLRDRQLWKSPRADEVRAKIEAIVEGFNEGNRTGYIHRCPMILVPVS